MQKIQSFMELIKTLHDRKSCIEFLESHRWQGIPICPHCHNQSEKHYKLKQKGEFNGLYKCRECKRRFTVTIGTMFEGSNLPLEKWFCAIWLFLSHKKGISSVQLAKDIGVTQKTAWFMLNRIRHNIHNDMNIMFDGITQIDETYVGGKSKGRFWQNQGRSLKQKTPVVGVLSEDKVYTIVVPNTTGTTLKGIIRDLVIPGSTIVTDGWRGYHGLSNEYNHQIVEHSKGSYVNKEGFHTNGIEGFWSHLKRGLSGIYHSVSPKHLSKYCKEFVYRYNTRFLTDIERFIKFITSAWKRLSYYDLLHTRYKEI